MRYVIGLMSGTSLDGIDAALVEIDEGSSYKEKFKVDLIEFITVDFSYRIQQEILECCSEETGTVDKICRMNFKLGELFAEAVHSLVEKAGINIDAVDLIGSHGQTIYHDVMSGDFNSTLQIGAAGIIAERTGITTISNFRVRDIAAGGEGAPLVPYVDYLLYNSQNYNRVLQNIGGIGNFCYLPAGGELDGVIGSDTGPGNMLIDGVISILTAGKLKYDKDGQWAGIGNVSQRLLDILMAHPFIKRKIPKTTGREVFGIDMARNIIERSKDLDISNYDIVTTVTAFTALSIIYSYHRFIDGGIDQIIIGGGGSYNKILIEMIKSYKDKILAGECQVLIQEELGSSSEAKEAIAFAVLAYQTMKGRSNNVPSVTGSRKSVVLGDITPGNNFFQFAL